MNCRFLFFILESAAWQRDRVHKYTQLCVCISTTCAILRKFFVCYLNMVIFP